MKKLIFLGILILISLISGCIQQTHIIEKECPQGIIPERLNLACEGEKGKDRLHGGFYCKAPDDPDEIGDWPIHLKWLDGVEIISGGPIWSCEGGNNEGENINYIYCPLEYFVKNPIKDNIVQKDIYYEIDLVLDSEDHTEEGYKIISSKCY